MAIRKEFMKSRPACKVTFKVSGKVANSSQQAHVVGDFNGWSTTATPMKRLKNGMFTATVELETGRAYQFRYLLGPSQWEDEPDADDYLPTPFGDSHNSVIIL